MRRWLAVVVSVIAVLGVLAPTADAQAPKVTINGLVDNISSWSRNMSVFDGNYNRTDTEWYARTRVRPDITAEVGTTKFVLGIEIDAAWGQWGAQDTNVCIGTACPSANPQRSGSNGGWDLNTDTIGLFEIKWAYTEFDVPWVPGGRIRLGAQPLGNMANYKVVYANGDAAGAYFMWSVTPAIRTHLAYIQVEEQSQESSAIAGNNQTVGGNVFKGLRAGSRGDDWAMIASAEITPFKGLDIRPMYSYFEADGTTSGSSRQGRGGVANAAPVALTVGAGGIPLGPGLPTIAAGAVLAVPGFRPQDIEARHTIGIDSRLRIGPFSLDPTVMYQFGSRDVACRITGSAALALRGCPTTGDITTAHQDIDAWLVDIRGGFQAGPLLVEAAFVWSSGNKSSDDLGDNVSYYQPLDTDTSYYATWANIFALGLDYFNILYSGVAGMNPGVSIGYDKYGLLRFGARATYALTPTFSPYVTWTSSWTDKEVDTNSIMTAGTGLIPIRQLPGGSGLPSKKESYLGTEFNLGFTWRLAPNLTFDMVGGYLFAGDALRYLVQPAISGSTVSNNAGNTSRDPEDVKTVAARLRFTF